MGKEGKERNMNTGLTMRLGIVRARHLHNSYLEGCVPDVGEGWIGQVRPGHREP